MLVKEYFKRVYPHIKAEAYYPSRANNGIFVTLVFCVAGSNHFVYTKGKRYTSEDVPLQRKLYDGSRTMTSDMRASFSPFNVNELAEFYEKNMDDAELDKAMLEFGIPPTMDKNKGCFCRALSLQFKAFVDSDSEEAVDDVMIWYKNLMSESQSEEESYQSVSTLYPGDQVYNKRQHLPTYNVNVYDEFQHTWEFENIGSQTWRGRRLYFENHGEVRPRAKNNYVDIPDTPPQKSVKISVDIDARGFEGRTECKWSMLDQDGNDCFPNSSMFSFVVVVKFNFDKQSEVIK